MNLPWEYCSVVKTFHQSSSFILESLFLQHFGNKTSSNQPSLKKIKKSNYSFSNWTFLNFYKYSISLMLNTSSKLQFLMISCDCDTRGCAGEVCSVWRAGSICHMFHTLLSISSLVWLSHGGYYRRQPPTPATPHYYQLYTNYTCS